MKTGAGAGLAVRPTTGPGNSESVHGAHAGITKPAPGRMGCANLTSRRAAPPRRPRAFGSRAVKSAPDTISAGCCRQRRIAKTDVADCGGCMGAASSSVTSGLQAADLVGVTLDTRPSLALSMAAYDASAKRALAFGLMGRNFWGQPSDPRLDPHLHPHPRRGILGLWAHTRLPESVKDENARSVVGQVTGIVSLLLALVLGTLIGTSFASSARRRPSSRRCRRRS